MEWIIIIKEFLRETSVDLAACILFFGIFYVIISLFIVICYQIKIEKIENKKQKEIKDFSLHTGMTTFFFEANIKAINKKYENDLEKLNRRKRFILEKMPFLRN